jgi:hypothetical protein
MLLKKKREIMEERLDLPIKVFLRKANLFTLFFILLMAASAALSYTQIFKTNDALKSQGFVSLASRVSVQRLNLHIRKLSYFSNVNNPTKFSDTMKDLYTELNLWTSDVMQLYFSGPGTHMKVEIKEWDGADFKIKKVNALQASILVSTYAQVVNQTGTAMFANRTQALKHPAVRFIFDNANHLTDFYTSVRQVEMLSHYNFINILRTSLLSCKSAIAVLAFIFSIIVPIFSFTSFRRRHNLILEMLLKTSKKYVLDTITTLEEEIELIAGDDEQLLSSSTGLNENVRRWKFIFFSTRPINGNYISSTS